MTAGGLFSQKSSTAIGVETGFVAAMVVVMSICHAVIA